ncbi:MAG: sigma-54-dependent Fis family transcriptional regulator, partial [Pseudomonadota bacterium]
MVNRPTIPDDTVTSETEEALSLIAGTGKLNYSENQIMTAWESFLTDTDRQDCPGVRSVVKDSWMRCKSVGIDARGTGAVVRNDDDYLHQLHENNHELIRAAADSMSIMKNLLDCTAAMIILTDRDGVILENYGDNRVLEAGRDIHLEVGGRWNEEVAGTNGIGTALQTGKPMLIHAAEHYCQDVKGWTCAAAPIFDPFDGSVLGVVDLSGPTKIFQRHNMTVPVIAARQIEQSLFQRGADERLRLMETFLDNAPTHNQEDGMVLLDRTGKVVCHKNLPGLKMHDTGQSTVNVGDVLFTSRPNMTEADVADALTLSVTPQVIRQLRLDGAIAGTVLIYKNEHASTARLSPVLPGKPDGRPVSVEKTGVPLPVILGESPEVTRVIDLIDRVATGKSSVLIEGETGVGKELFGQLFHARTATSSKTPLVTVNCGAITKELIASELFGHVPGAFTGALRDGKQGKFEQASGGVLCLDEIGELPLDIQPFLLRALEEKVIYRVGDTKPRPVDVRVVALTNRDLLQEVEAGRFRRDLYYRVGAIKIAVPPLRERGDDSAILLDYFRHQIAKDLDEPPLEFSQAAMEVLNRYRWPGNVRELRNLVESLHLTSQAGVVDASDLLSAGIAAGESDHSGTAVSPDPSQNLKDMATMEYLTIKAAIESNGGNLTLAAKQVGIARSTLYRKMQQFD